MLLKSGFWWDILTDLWMIQPVIIFWTSGYIVVTLLWIKSRLSGEIYKMKDLNIVLLLYKMSA